MDDPPAEVLLSVPAGAIAFAIVIVTGRQVEEVRRKLPSAGVDQPHLFLRRPLRALDAVAKEDPVEETELTGCLVQIIADRVSTHDRLSGTPGLERKPEGE